MSYRHSAGAWLAAMMLLAGCGPAEQDATVRDSALAESLREASAAYAGREIEALAGDDSAMQLAERLFAANCASCHGAEGRGKQGVMDLVDGVYNYGSGADAVRATIADGRRSVMPGVGSRYGEMNLGQLVAYVESLSAGEPASRLGEQGKELFDETCAACHGSDGRGNAEMGGPNLADDYWLHGDTMMAIRLIITRGAEGQCPAQAPSLSPAEIDLLTAYVLGIHER